MDNLQNQNSSTTPNTNSVPIQPVAQFHNSEPSSSKMPIVFVVLILIMVVLGAGIYLGRNYFSATPLTVTPMPIVSAPTASPTATSRASFANWKTYKNEKYGFEFKYPGNWKENTINKGNGSYSEPYRLSGFDDVLLKTNMNGLIDGKIFIRVFDIQYQKNLIKDLSNFNIEVDNYSGYRQLNSDDGRNYESVYLFSGDSRYILEIARHIFDKSDAEDYLSVNQKTENIFNQILSTFKFTAPVASASSISAIPTLKAQIINYQLPTGWKTVQDNTQSFEMGYNADLLNANPGERIVEFYQKKYYGSFGFSIQPYNGGSRHQFIYDQLGYTNGVVESDKTKDFYEKEYRYNGWSCLVLYGLTFSASGTTWGMCAVSPNQAIFINGLDESTTVQMIGTIKMLK